MQSPVAEAEHYEQKNPNACGQKFLAACLTGHRNQCRQSRWKQEHAKVDAPNARDRRELENRQEFIWL